MDPETVVREAMEALLRGDDAAVAIHPGYHETRTIFPSLLAAFPDLQHAVEQQFACGDQVATRLSYRGTHRGHILGFVPTGKVIEFEVVAINRVVDGIVVEHNAASSWALALQRAFLAG